MISSHMRMTVNEIVSCSPGVCIYLSNHLLRILTRIGCIHSNKKFMRLGSTRYMTAVNSICSTSPSMQKYAHLTSGSVEVPLVSTARNSSSIREEPVS